MKRFNLSSGPKKKKEIYIFAFSKLENWKPSLMKNENISWYQTFSTTEINACR